MLNPYLLLWGLSNFFCPPGLYPRRNVGLQTRVWKKCEENTDRVLESLQTRRRAYIILSHAWISPLNSKSWSLNMKDETLSLEKYYWRMLQGALIWIVNDMENIPIIDCNLKAIKFEFVAGLQFSYISSYPASNATKFE